LLLAASSDQILFFSLNLPPMTIQITFVIFFFFPFGLYGLGWKWNRSMKAYYSNKWFWLANSKWMLKEAKFLSLLTHRYFEWYASYCDTCIFLLLA
jgi:hypothetical protein